MGLADKIADRYARIFPEHEHDIRSSAYLGAVRAASTFDPDKSMWGRWSKTTIKHEIQDFIRGPWIDRYKRANVGLAVELEELEDKRTGLGESSSAAAELSETIDKLLEMLTPRQKEVCTLVYKYGMKPSEAGRALGLSKFRGCDLHNEAIRFLRETLQVA